VIQDSFDLRPASRGGSIPGAIFGNDQILWGNVLSTYYVVAPLATLTDGTGTFHFADQVRERRSIVLDG